MKLFLIPVLSLVSFLSWGQQGSCYLQQSKNINLTTVDKNDLQCIARNSDKPNTVFYTLASWCAPCIKHLPDALRLEKDYNTNVYVLLVESEEDNRLKNAVKIVENESMDAKMLVLKDSVYEGGVKKRNKAFINDITPAQFEIIPDFSKFIVINDKGEVVMVTNWKDYKKLDKKNVENVQQMLSHTVVPLIQ
ncbi:thioredoxin family protein [Chryseobacterium sp.]|uniref:TlpA family protein disulfide reductase n=1 Tax=Chryseobacterium sp. TaxID=1871047 RepID=UPI0025C00150|nr:thioredoxin family protein [Chryseobacterium sp.]